MVGAQRPLNVIGSDAAINLISALRVAVDPEARGKGVLVVLNDEIHQAREVTKTSTYRLSAFKSPDGGALGVVDADRISFSRQPVRGHTQVDAVSDLGNQRACRASTSPMPMPDRMRPPSMPLSPRAPAASSRQGLRRECRRRRNATRSKPRRGGV